MVKEPLFICYSEFKLGKLPKFFGILELKLTYCVEQMKPILKTLGLHWVSFYQCLITFGLELTLGPKFHSCIGQIDFSGEIEIGSQIEVSWVTISPDFS